MLKLKIEKSKKNEPILKINSKSLDENELKFLKRVLIEGKEVKGIYNYIIPIRFLIPIVSINKENIKIDRYSKLTYFEFSDIYDENYYYTFEVTPKYMRKWREEACPDIFKISLDKNTCQISKEIVFKKIKY